MTKKETITLLKVLKVSYPKFSIADNDEELQLQINTWYAIFKDESYPVIQQATLNLIKTFKYPPSIADVKEAIFKLQNPDIMTEQEALNTIIDSLDYYRPKRAFENLPPILQKIVGSADRLKEWSQMDVQTVTSVIGSNLQRSYRVMLQREIENQKTGKWQPTVDRQIEAEKEPKQIENQKTQKEKEEEQKSILEIIAKAKKLAKGEQ